MRVAMPCLLLILAAGCTLFQERSQSPDDQLSAVYGHDGSEIPSIVWETVAKQDEYATDDPRMIRNIEAQRGLRYADSKFYSFYEHQRTKPGKKNQHRKILQVAQWVGTIATGYFSWRVGQSNNESETPSNSNAMNDMEDMEDKKTNYNDRLAKVGIVTVGLTALNSMLDDWHDESKEKPTDILTLERNRKGIKDCITTALANKPVDKYTIAHVKDDLDDYYWSGSESTTKLTDLWYLHCARP